MTVKNKYKIIIEPKYGYYRLDPLPSEEKLHRFYHDEYFKLIKSGGRAPELKRFMEGGEEKRSELEWLSSTLWLDVHKILSEHLSFNHELRLLDFGCGPGHFLSFMKEQGWYVVGIEPSIDATQMASQEFDVKIYESLEKCLQVENEPFNAIVCLNVLEHVRNPVEVIENFKKIMFKNGILVIRLPNDFSELQECAQKNLKSEPWWVAPPDHINYFNFSSLTKLLNKLGYETIDKMGDFPMELFLLFGDDYVGNKELGTKCHKKLVSFELSIPKELRRQLYRCFAENGMGRDMLFFAKLK